jgi:hypothetical protein
MPPFTVDQLEAALVGRPAIPLDDRRLIAEQVCRRYDDGGPPQTEWRVRTIMLATTHGKRWYMYELCRARCAGPVYLASTRGKAQAVADALNGLEELAHAAEDESDAEG